MSKDRDPNPKKSAFQEYQPTVFDACAIFGMVPAAIYQLSEGNYIRGGLGFVAAAAMLYAANKIEDSSNY